LDYNDADGTALKVNDHMNLGSEPVMRPKIFRIGQVSSACGYALLSSANRNLTAEGNNWNQKR
jgi:hypothetical protein